MIRKRSCIVLALLGITGVVWVSCVQDVGESLVARFVRAVQQRYDEAGLGFDPGVSPSAPLREFAIAGGSVSTQAGELRIAFTAFVTAAPADDADGQGNPLDPENPADNNGMDDVFLSAVVDTGIEISGRPTPVAFTQGIVPVMRDARCTRCHSYHYPTGWRVNGHIGEQPEGSNEGCNACHVTAEILDPDKAPETIAWLAPDPEQMVFPTQDFRDKTDAELLALVLTRNDPIGHLSQDDKILWAIDHGLVPFRGPAEGGRVPMEAQQWQDLVAAWDLGGMRFSTDQAVKDTLLVSRDAFGTASGDGASTQPAIAYEGNPAFDPGNPGATFAGTVWVAFASTSTDILGTATAGNCDIYRAQVRVFLDANNNVDLQFVNGTLIASQSGGGGGNADSDGPAISADGRYVGFTSKASDLLLGTAFVDNNGRDRSDVFFRDFSGPVRLVSQQVGGVPGNGCNGDCAQVAMGQGFDFLAFSSDASDLVDNDTNGVRDVFVTEIEVGSLATTRASVATGGNQSTGASDRPSLFVDPVADRAWVAFESSGLEAGAAPLVYVRDVSAAATTRISDQGAPAHAPQLSPDGQQLVFLSAQDLDPIREDGNEREDVIALDFAAFRGSGTQAFTRRSLALNGTDADGAVAEPLLAGFRNSAGSFQIDSLLGFTTTAQNLGRSPNSDLVLQFLIDRTVPRTLAQFTAEPVSGVAPLTVQFEDLSSNAVTWDWVFGDGQNSTEQDPQITYAATGDYDVQLTVTGPSGASSIIKTDFVSVRAPLTWGQIYVLYDLQSTCAGGGCHDAAPGAALFSMTSATTARNNLVNVPAVNAGCGTNRVTPGNLTDSSLIDAIEPAPVCVPFRMGSLSAQAIQDIKDWIVAGAQP